MRHFPRFLLAVSLLLTPLSSFANTVTLTNLNANLTLYPNNGTGDNLGGTIYGIGANLQVGGGTPYYWLNDMDGIAPGSGGIGGTTIYFDYASGILGSQSYGDGQTAIGTAIFNVGYFTFPTNGKNFTVTVQASLGLVAVLGCDNNGNCQTYNLLTAPGHLTMSFDYVNGLYYGTQGYFTTAPVTATPEPGTLGLIVVGIGAVAWCRRKHWCRRRQMIAVV